MAVALAARTHSDCRGNGPGVAGFGSPAKQHGQHVPLEALDIDSIRKVRAH